jgi:hypothetical protein
MIWRYEYFKGSKSDKKWSKIATPRHNFSEQVHVLKLCMSIDDDDQSEGDWKLGARDRLVVNGI